MPRLKSIQEKYVNGFKVDKENDEVIYSDGPHVYVGKDDNKNYISVTTLIDRYVHPFDKDFWSAYKACEALLDSEIFIELKGKLLNTRHWDDSYIKKYKIDLKQFNEKRKEILDGYAKANKEACERGTTIHAQYEEAFYGTETHTLKKYGIGGSFTCKKGYYKLDIEKGIYPEFLVSLKSRDSLLRIAGQIDLLIKDGNDIEIRDYKTNSEIKRRSYYNPNTKSNIMMKYPLNNLMDCNYYHYSLQLSLYAYLLQNINPNFNIRKLSLIHIDHDGIESEIPVTYLKEDVIRMLKHYKNELRQKNILERDKPIIF